MLFTQPIFLVFFALVFALVWKSRSNAHRKVVLLLASCVFYGAWDWRFLGLIFLSTVIDYVAALRMGGTDADALRKRWLWLSLTANLGLLGFFKYFNFFVESASALLAPLGMGVGVDRALQIVLPVGISFYTFQTMSYTIDVYRRQLEPVRSFVDFALFVTFFPQLVAGPIVRAIDFLPQLNAAPAFPASAARRFLLLFLSGFVKKTCVADNLAPHIDRVFADPSVFATTSVVLAVLLYAVQIYCDFSGYSDMAIACAGLLGYHLVPNFHFPYFAANITEFWRRWHMSLSTWLRDYLYIPLGGNRGSRLFTYRNLLLTMLLGGLWHGAAWTFVLWGALHGLALIAHRELRRLWPASSFESPFWRLAGTAATFYFVCVAWIFFRAASFEQAVVLLKAFTFFGSPGRLELATPLFWLFPGLVGCHALASRAVFVAWFERLPSFVFGLAFGTMSALALAFVPLRAEPFIYFQF